MQAKQSPDNVEYFYYTFIRKLVCQGVCWCEPNSEGADNDDVSVFTISHHIPYFPDCKPLLFYPALTHAEVQKRDSWKSRCKRILGRSFQFGWCWLGNHEWLCWQGMLRLASTLRHSQTPCYVTLLWWHIGNKPCPLAVMQSHGNIKLKKFVKLSWLILKCGFCLYLP